jgi:hypothetical protein
VSLGAYWTGGSAGGYWPVGYWTDDYWSEGDGEAEYDSVYWRLLVGVQTALQGLNLPHIIPLSVLPATRIYLEKVPNWRNKDAPCIIVSPSAGETVGGKVNARDDIGYAIDILFVFRDEQNQADNFELELRWRQMIRRTFNKKKLDQTTIPEQYDCDVVRNVVFDTSAWWGGGYALSRVGLRFTTREVRDPTA